KQIEMLDRIGMVWEIKDPWEIGFSHAEQYFHDFGNLLVPNSDFCTDGYRLGTWISNQRNNYNNPKKYYIVTAKQAKRLESIGMKWKQDSQWEKSFGIAKNYYEQFGNLRVPRHATVDGLKLYDWIADQRRKYRKGQLSDDRIRKLNSIGIDLKDSNNDEIALTVIVNTNKRAVI
ncbi:MAG: helicase associated domain-containing protein, partial [Clostridia bacterium]|nr:helicase associated domain-containing protein [Clostridia bacterium]